ncbi:MAG TPA: GNAT family N-acetyltransferase [Candidatus Limnocylindrales bacterium]|nr:GNAT family N-acetyltransferase [Candidatus Limnocylindrales bacterium]
MTDPAISADQIRLLERYEMTCWRTWYMAPGPSLIDTLGLRFENLYGAQVAISPKLDFLLFNRVLGLGNEEPVSPAIVDRIVQTYLKSGVQRFFMQVSPVAEPKSLTVWLRERGFQMAEPWAKLKRGVAPVPDIDFEPTIKQIAPSDRTAATTWGQIVQTAFEYPAPTAEWFAGLVDLARWRAYLAYEGERAVGAAAMFVNGEWASFEIGVVLPEAQNRGIHSALIARRIKDAAAAGCKILSMETSAEKGQGRAQSFRNARRMGFDLAYFRENWVWNGSVV